MSILGASLIVAGPIWFHAGWTIDAEHDEDLAIPAFVGVMSFVFGIAICAVAA